MQSLTIGDHLFLQQTIAAEQEQLGLSLRALRYTLRRRRWWWRLLSFKPVRWALASFALGYLLGRRTKIRRDV